MKIQAPRGFTLVEVAIVLVIIGLLLGGVLKGQELINSAKAKAVINDFRNVSVMINTYQDRFRALPGDDRAVTQHLAGAVAADAAQLGNGLINGAWDSTTATDESYLAWQHLRLANLTSGSTSPSDPGYRPANSEGGVLGLQSGRPAGAPATGITGRVFVCQNQINGRIAQQVDATMEGDNNLAGGSVFVLKADKSGPAAAPLDDSTYYIVCAGF